MNLIALHKNICDFVERWKDQIPSKDDPRSLDIISDWAVCGGCDLELSLKQEDSATTGKGK